MHLKPELEKEFAVQPITQVDINNFQAEVIDKSENVSVILEFWSPTVPQCATLSTQLTQLVHKADGNWVLARMNVADPQNQQIAMQLQIQGIPAVKAFQNGKLVDEFSGLPPLSQLEAWLERFAPDDTSAIVVAARQALQDGDTVKASELFKALQEIEPEDLRPVLGFAEIAITMGDKDAAVDLIGQIPEAKIDDDIKGWHSKVELLITGFGKDKSVYEKAIESDPLDYDSRFELAMLNATDEEYEQAFEHLVHIVSRNPKSGDEAKDEPIRIEEKARLSAIKLFDVVGSGSELAIEWRKKLGRAMY